MLIITVDTLLGLIPTTSPEIRIGHCSLFEILYRVRRAQLAADSVLFEYSLEMKRLHVVLDYMNFIQYFK